VARGASLSAAMLSPLFKVADFEVQEYNSLPVSITYQFTSDPENSFKIGLVDPDMRQGSLPSERVHQ